jgi:hypothetical protein
MDSRAAKLIKSTEDSLRQANDSLALVAAEIREARRDELRREMRTDLNSIGRYVVETCIAYRQELDALQADVHRLTEERNQVQKVNKSLCSAMEEVAETCKMVAKPLCGQCGHILSCFKGKTCAYCFVKVCACCSRYCHKSGCHTIMCGPCKKLTDSEYCVIHNDALDEAQKLAYQTKREQHKQAKREAKRERDENDE